MAAGANAVIKILEITFHLIAASEETADLLNTTISVDRNLSHARSLYRSVLPNSPSPQNHANHQERLTSSLTPSDQTWIERTLLSTEETVRDIAKILEPSRVSTYPGASSVYGGDRGGTTMKKGRLGLMERALWVFKDSAKVTQKFRRLEIEHQGLMNIISLLYSKGASASSSTNTNRGGTGDRSGFGGAWPQQPPPPAYDDELEDLFSLRDLRRTKSSSHFRNGSASTVASPTDSSMRDAFSPLTPATTASTCSENHLSISPHQYRNDTFKKAWQPPIIAISHEPGARPTKSDYLLLEGSNFPTNISQPVDPFNESSIWSDSIWDTKSTQLKPCELGIITEREVSSQLESPPPLVCEHERAAAGLCVGMNVITDLKKTESTARRRMRSAWIDDHDNDIHSTY